MVQASGKATVGMTSTGQGEVKTSIGFQLRTGLVTRTEVWKTGTGRPPAAADMETTIGTTPLAGKHMGVRTAGMAIVPGKPLMLQMADGTIIGMVGRTPTPGIGTAAISPVSQWPQPLEPQFGTRGCIGSAKMRELHSTTMLRKLLAQEQVLWLETKWSW